METGAAAQPPPLCSSESQITYRHPQLEAFAQMFCKIHRIARLRLRILFISATAIVAAFAYLGGTSPVSAAGHEGLTLFPTKIEVTGKPGGEAQESITLVNSDGRTLGLTTDISDYIIRPDNSFVFLPPGDTSYSSALWTSLDKREFTIQPGQSKTVAVKVSIPKQAEPGGHYSSVIFKIRSEAESRPGIKIVSAIAVQILTAVGDGSQIIRDGIVSGLRNTNGNFDREVESSVTFKNRGNVHLSIKGHVNFYDFRGEKIGTAPLQPITVLPKTSRISKAKWVGPRVGLIMSKATVEYGPNLATYDTKRFSPKEQFWILPWREGIAVLAILIALVIILRSGKGPHNPERKVASLGIVKRSIRRLEKSIRKAA